MPGLRTVFQQALLGLALWLGLALPGWAALPIEHWVQASGARVYFVESPTIPMLSVQIDFDAGMRREPAQQVGLASATALLLSKGIAAQGQAPALDENAVSQAWADLGASFGAAPSLDRMSFNLRSLTDPALLEQAVALAARQLAEPAFPDAIWQRERQRLVADLRESYTRPASVAGREYGKTVYGGHPYGHEMTEASLGRISVFDMRAFHQRHIAPCRARVSLVGAISRAQADALSTRLLARLPQSACSSLAAFPPVPEVEPLPAAKEVRIPFKSSQAHVLMGQPGYKRSDPDFFALTVGNYVLGGGGFVSRLTTQVREKRGLSYSVYSYFSPGLHAGAFTIGLQTRPDQAEQAIGVVRDVLQSFVAEGPTAAELQAAKDNLMGGFALRIDSNAKLLDNIANMAWNDLPLDYLDTWTAQVERLTVADIRAAFQRKLQPDRLLTLVLGAGS